MKGSDVARRMIPWIASLASAVCVLVWSLPSAAGASPNEAGGENSCLDCHLTLTTKLAVPAREWLTSIHAEYEVACTDCHGGDPLDPTVEGAMVCLFPRKRRPLLGFLLRCRIPWRAAPTVVFAMRLESVMPLNSQPTTLTAPTRCVWPAMVCLFPRKRRRLLWLLLRCRIPWTTVLTVASATRRALAALLGFPTTTPTGPTKCVWYAMRWPLARRQ